MPVRIINTLALIVFVCAAYALQGSRADAQDYQPEGPQTNVPVATVEEGGWTECYRDTYDIFMDAETVLTQCTGGRLMLACRETGSETLTLLAQGARSDVTFDTGGDNTDETHIANGVGWYFNISVVGENEDGANAWGFVRAGDSVSKNNCDIDTSGANDERLCWHLQRTEGGYRCGAIEDLNASTEYERIVYVASPDTPPPAAEQIPTLSEWGLMAMAGIMGLAGILVMRRKKAAA